MCMCGVASSRRRSGVPDSPSRRASSPTTHRRRGTVRVVPGRGSLRGRVSEAVYDDLLSRDGPWDVVGVDCPCPTCLSRCPYAPSTFPDVPFSVGHTFQYLPGSRDPGRRVTTTPLLHTWCETPPSVSSDTGTPVLGGKGFEVLRDETLWRLRMAGGDGVWVG